MAKGEGGPPDISPDGTMGPSPKRAAFDASMSRRPRGRSYRSQSAAHLQELIPTPVSLRF